MRKVMGIRLIWIARLRVLFMSFFANSVHGFFVSMITSDFNKGWLLTFKLNCFFLQSYLMMMVTMKMAMQVKLLVKVLPLLAS